MACLRWVALQRGSPRTTYYKEGKRARWLAPFCTIAVESNQRQPSSSLVPLTLPVLYVVWCGAVQCSVVYSTVQCSTVTSSCDCDCDCDCGVVMVVVAIAIACTIRTDEDNEDGR